MLSGMRIGTKVFSGFGIGPSQPQSKSKARLPMR
jgi:hypothetical protein